MYHTRLYARLPSLYVYARLYNALYHTIPYPYSLSQLVIHGRNGHPGVRLSLSVPVSLSLLSLL
jgi:hypothetical protein